MRLFSNGRTDYQGPAHLPNLAATRIKKQVGGGKVTKVIAWDSNSKDDEPLSMSPSPAPLKLCSMTHKGNTVEPLHAHKRVEVIVPMVTCKRLPSIILLNSSGSEESNVEENARDVSGDTGKPFVLDDEQALPACKHKAKSQHYSHMAKRVAAWPDMNFTPRADPKKVKTQATKKTRFQIESPPLNSTDDLEAPENLQSRRIAVAVPARGVRADTPMNLSSSRVFIKPQQPSKELRLEQCKSSFIRYPCSITSILS